MGLLPMIVLIGRCLEHSFLKLAVTFVCLLLRLVLWLSLELLKMDR